MSDEKAVMRREAIRARDRIDPQNGEAEAAARHFIETLAPKPGQIVAPYWPKGREFDTLPLMQDLMEAGIVCALPVIVKGEKCLKFAAYRDGTKLVEGPFGIMQPVVNDKTQWAEPDMIVVPLLAFDRRGHRLGYGSGYYDATIAHYRARKDITAIGYGYAQQAVLFNLPAEAHDEKMDWIITPQKAQKVKV